jgi:hypothetical protein
MFALVLRLHIKRICLLTTDNLIRIPFSGILINLFSLVSLSLCGEIGFNGVH